MVRSDLDRDLLTAEEVASHLKVSTQTVISLIHKGELVGLRIGAQLRVDPVDLAEYKAAARVKATSRQISVPETLSA